MQVKINIRTHKKPTSNFAPLTFYKKEFSNLWDGPILPIGTKVDFLGVKGRIANVDTDLFCVEIHVEMAIKDQEEFETLEEGLRKMNYFVFDVP